MKKPSLAKPKKKARKFYKTTILVEVLSEEPYEYQSLEAVAYDITEGDCSGQVSAVTHNELTALEMAKALQEQGSDPGFFQLNERGEDAEDDI